MLLWLNIFKKKKKLKAECVTGDVLYPEKKKLRSIKQRQMQSHISGFREMRQSFILTCSPGASTQRNRPGKPRLTPP